MVRLEIPDSEKHKCRRPDIHGEHFGYDGAMGTLIATAGENGAWVAFKDKYVGCPTKWLRKVEDAV
jgi:hypothetical protein